MTTLWLKIEGELGKITIRAVMAQIEANIRMLADYDRGLSGEPRGTLEWVVTRVEGNSIGLYMRSRTRRADVDYGPTVAQYHVEGWNLIEHENRTPPYLTERTMETTRAAVRLFGRQGLTGISIADVPDAATEEPPRNGAVDVTTRAATNIQQLLTVRYQALGSVEGTIETVSVHGGRRFILYLSRTNKAVTCHVTDGDWLRRAGELLESGHRVLVHGRVYRNAQGEPLRVDVQGMRLLGTENELPSIQSLTGSRPNFTGGLTTEEYIREMRGA